MIEIKYDDLYFIRHITNNHVAAQYFTLYAAYFYAFDFFWIASLRSQGRSRHCEDVVRSNPEPCTKLNRVKYN
jgi:hypothetical protein